MTNRLERVQARLQKVFRTKLPLRRAALVEACERWREGDPEAAATLRRLAHQLHGSGGSFGFHDISSVAAVVEQASDDDLLETTAELIVLLKKHGTEIEDALRILLVEDDGVMSRTIADHLVARGRIVTPVGSVERALNRLQEHTYDVILLDLMLPGQDGRDLLNRISMASPAPVIVVSARTEARSECLALGAARFIEKPLDFDLLDVIVSQVVEQGQLVRQQAVYDPLTSVYNRRGLEDAAEMAFSRARREASPLGLAILDLDRFKQVNDTYGHLVGDKVLQHFAALLTEHLRGADIIGRWGGEEFVILLPDTSLENAQGVIEHLLSIFQGLTITTSRDRELNNLSFSAGLVAVNPKESLGENIDRADMLLLQAKRQGRAQVSVRTGVLRRRALIVEDDEDVASFLCELLSAEGFAVDVAHSRAEASGMLEAQHYRVLVLDFLLPDGTGLEVLEEARRSIQHRDAVVLMLTALDEVESIEEAFSLGIDDYLVKPFRPREFLARVRRFIERSGSGRKKP